MKYLIIILLISSYFNLFAQNPKYVILKDSINLKGYVKYFDGKPAKFIMVNSNALYEDIYTKTNESGYFEINTIAPSDTLIVNHQKFSINGSRFMLIMIPKFERKLESSEIIAKRLNTKDTHPISIENKTPKYFDHKFNEFSATYPGGIDNFTKSLKKNIKYPTEAIKANIEGEVVIKFTVDSIGKVIDPTIIKGIGYGCEKEVINQLLKLKNWYPAVKSNSRVNQDFVLTYKFRLED